MDANELRIGNYITDEWANEGAYFPVHFVHPSGRVKFGKDGKYSCKLESARPIPLNEQWLLEFGAIKIRAPYLGYKFSRFKLISKKSHNYWYVIDWQDETYMTKIEFVHEFQNFIYVMDGKELTRTTDK